MNRYIYYKALMNDIFWFLKRKVFYRNSASILMYHSVGYNNIFFTVNPKDFEWQMEYLRKNNYKVIPLNYLVEKIKNEEILEKNTVVITFDDGYEDNFTNVYPIIKRCNYPVTIFLSTGLVSDKKNELKMLSWEKIKEMYENGIDFEPHTYSHVRLKKINNSEAKNEILKSKEDIENNLNKKCLSFAYPWGQFSKETINIIKELNFTSGLTVKKGFVKNNSDLYQLPRNSIDSMVTKIRFMLKI